MHVLDKTLWKGKSKISWCFKYKFAFLTVKDIPISYVQLCKGIYFRNCWSRAPVTVLLRARHMPSSVPKAAAPAWGPWRQPMLDFIKQTQLPEKTWDDSLCQAPVVLICHMLLGHLYTVKTNLSTFTQIFFISSSVLKMGLYPGKKSYSGMKWEQAEQKQRSLEGLPGLCWCVTTSSPVPALDSAARRGRPVPDTRPRSSWPDVEHLPSIHPYYPQAAITRDSEDLGLACLCGPAPTPEFPATHICGRASPGQLGQIPESRPQFWGLPRGDFRPPPQIINK